MDTKFNNGEPINIDEIDNEDLSQAFHEWAEGSPALEDLFHACHEQGIKTWASDAHTEPQARFTRQEYGMKGGTPDELVVDPASPYISIIFDEHSEEYMKSIFELLKDNEFATCALSLNSDNNTYNNKSTFTVNPSPEHMEEIFSLMSQDIRREKSEKIDSPGFDKLKHNAEMFKDLGCGISNKDTKLDIMFMRLSLTVYKIRENIKNIFTKKDIKQLPETTISDLSKAENNKKPSWELTPEQLQEYNNKLKNKEEKSPAKETEPQKLDERLQDDERV